MPSYHETFTEGGVICIWSYVIHGKSYCLWSPQVPRSSHPRFACLSGSPAHLKIIHYSLSKDNITGSLIRTSLEATKLELGLPGSVLSQDFSKHGCLVTKTWCTHTWEFLHSNGTDKVSEHYTQREHDQFLTEAFATASFSESQRICLNKCTIFLQGDPSRHHHWRWASVTPISMAGPPGPRYPIQVPMDKPRASHHF
jgi:hypothetical protein